MTSVRGNLSESLIPPLTSLAVFALACTFAWVYYDDPVYYTANPLLGDAPLFTRLIAAWTVAPEANWMPVTWTVAIMADQLFEGSANAIHIISVIIHGFNAWLAWLVLCRLGLSSWSAVACACLWAVHPLRMESVAWASGLKDVLSGCFALGMLALMTNHRQNWRSDWPAFLLFVGSLLSKQMMIAFPAALLLWDYRKTELNLLSLIFARMKWWIASISATVITLMVNLYGIGLRETEGYDSFGGGLLRGFAAFGHQFQQLFAPMELSPEYLIESATVFKTMIGLIILSGALVALIILLKKRGNISAWCFVSAIGLFFPLAGWTPSPMEFTADRLSYIPHFFAIAAIGLALQNYRFAMHGVAIFAVASVVMTASLLPVWKNGDTLNRHMLKVHPEHPTALENRGTARALQGDLDGAIDDFLAVTRSHPRRVSAWANAVRALAASGELQQASDVLDEAISIHPDRPELREMQLAIRHVDSPQ